MSALFETCPICGKRKVIMWPEFWVYRRGNTFYCSEMCLDVSVVRNTKQKNIEKAKIKERINYERNDSVRRAVQDDEDRRLMLRYHPERVC